MGGAGAASTESTQEVTTNAQENTGAQSGPSPNKGGEHLLLRGRVAQHSHPGVSGDNAMTCQKRKARAEGPKKGGERARERKPGERGEAEGNTSGRP